MHFCVPVPVFVQFEFRIFLMISDEGMTGLTQVGSSIDTCICFKYIVFVINFFLLCVQMIDLGLREIPLDAQKRNL